MSHTIVEITILHERREGGKDGGEGGEKEKREGRLGGRRGADHVTNMDLLHLPGLCTHSPLAGKTVWHINS